MQGRVTWKTDGDRLFLLSNGLPVGSFRFCVFAMVRGLQWVWSWEDSHNILDIRLLLGDDVKKSLALFPRDISPDGLSSDDPRITTTLLQSKCLWYCFLVEDHQVIVAGIRDVLKWYV